MTESDVTVSLHSNSGNKEDYEQEETVNYNDSIFASSSSGSSFEDPIHIHEEDEATESKEEERDIMEEQTETSSSNVTTFNEFEVLYKTQEIFNYYSKVSEEERKRFLLEVVNDFGGFEGLNRLYNKVQTPFLERQAFAATLTTNNQKDNNPSYSINTNGERQSSNVINIHIQGNEMKKCVSPSSVSLEEHVLGNTKEIVDVKERIQGALSRVNNNYKSIMDGSKKHQPVKNFLKEYKMFLAVVDFKDLLGNVTKVKEMVKTFGLDELLFDLDNETKQEIDQNSGKPSKKPKKK
ncbi:hypothetical protein ABK040_010096 [Willaertia magna]